MFELTKEDQQALRSHFGTLKRGVHAKYLSFAFTQEGAKQAGKFATDLSRQLKKAEKTKNRTTR